MNERIELDIDHIADLLTSQIADLSKELAISKAYANKIIMEVQSLKEENEKLKLKLNKS